MEILHDVNLKQKNIRTGSTQDYLDIDEIKADVIILKNGGMRAVVMCSSVNFGLKSTEEQEAIVAAYQQFLNSLDFPIQIVINSRSMDLSDYLNFIDERYREQKNDLLKIQIAEYKDFIKELVKVSDVMSKHFYVVIPFSPLESKEDNPVSKFMTLFSGSKPIKQDNTNFQRYKSQLWQRVRHVVNGLAGMSVNAEPLNTQELIELFYTLYNPSSTGGHSRVTDIDKLDIESTNNYYPGN
jgi:hypothetical protein